MMVVTKNKIVKKENIPVVTINGSASIFSSTLSDMDGLVDSFGSSGSEGTFLVSESSTLYLYSVPVS